MATYVGGVSKQATALEKNGFTADSDFLKKRLEELGEDRDAFLSVLALESPVYKPEVVEDEE